MLDGLPPMIIFAVINSVSSDIEKQRGKNPNLVGWSNSCGIHIMVIIPACLVGDGGSIPPCRAKNMGFKH